MKIGILTHYYLTHNFGGILQAYALTRFLNDNGFDAEQIRYSSRDSSPSVPARRFSESINPSVLLHSLIDHIYRDQGKKCMSLLEKRYQLFGEFEREIPHGERVFFRDTIKDSNLLYDCFIVGSDQVWNPLWSDDSFFLSFCDEGKPKIAYSASVGSLSLTENEKVPFKKYLPSYLAISLRESETKKMLESFLSGCDLHLTVDPTMLLSRSDWDVICPDRIIQEDYVLYYCLSDDENARSLVSEYAKIHHCKIVNIPNRHGVKTSREDIYFGDYALFDISPKDFISLIKYTRCVFTNSFHACVFSCIYEKVFFAFKRKGETDMSDRIHTLCGMYHCEERFCDTEEKLKVQYLEEVVVRDSKLIPPEGMIQKSKTFLFHHLERL